MAEATRFGIPLTISTDPRNNFLYVAGDKAAALYADFGDSDHALLEVLLGKQKATGRLPLSCPRP